MAHRNQQKRFLPRREFQDLFDGIIMECAYGHTSQSEGTRLQHYILRGMSRFNLHVARGSVPVFDCRALVYGSYYKHGRRGPDTSLVERGCRKRPAEVAGGCRKQLMPFGPVLEYALFEDNVYFQRIKSPG